MTSAQMLLGWFVVNVLLLALWGLLGSIVIAWTDARAQQRRREMADPLQRALQDLTARGEWELWADYEAGRTHPRPKERAA
jgi:hypothetical protein